jgi:hypothetical protein
MKADKKAELIKAIRSTWSSLDSHLDYTLTPIKTKSKEMKAIHGGKRFHTTCVKDYAETLLTLAKLL